MGQIFACILPSLFQTKVKEFSNIEDESSPKRARLIKRKTSRKDATYRAEVSLPGTVTTPDDIEPNRLEDNVIKLTEKVKAKIGELKIVRSDKECRHSFPNSLHSFRQVEETRESRNDDLQKTARLRIDRNVVQEAWGIKPENLVPLPRPRDFYRKMFGAKERNTNESPASAETRKEKSGWKLKLLFHRLLSFVWRNGKRDGSETRNGDKDIVRAKCEVGLNSSGEGLVTGDYVTAEGCNVKVICVQPLASSSSTSVSAAADKRPLEPKVTTSVSKGSGEMKEQEVKTCTLPPLPRPSPWKEMYHKLIRPNELSVLQQRHESSSSEPRNRKAKKSGLMKGIRKSKLKIKRRKKKQKKQKVQRVALIHENDTASSSTSCSSTLTPPNPVRVILVAEADETAATPLAAMATTD